MDKSLSVDDYIIVVCDSGYTWIARVKKDFMKYVVSIYEDGWKSIKCDAIVLKSRNNNLYQFKANIILNIYIPNVRNFKIITDEKIINRFLEYEKSKRA